MKNFFPILTALGLLASWAALLLALPSVLGIFPDFKIEAPPLTVALIWSYNLFKGLALPLAVGANALLLALKRRLGWIFGLVLCLAHDLAFVALFFPLISLVNSLGGDDAPLAPSAPILPVFQSSLGAGWGIALAVGALVLNQIVFVLLLLKRRDFER